MCLGGGGDGGAAARQEQQIKADEEKRQRKIKHGQTAIDIAFKQYNDPFFSRFRQTYTDSANPDVQNQFATAQDQLSAQLADRGILSSTIAGNAFSNLQRTRDNAQTDIANKAADASNAFRNQVEQTKSNLYSLNTAAADPQMIANRAQGEATSLVAPSTTTPLGDLFGSVLAPFAAYTRASIYSPYGRGAGGFNYAPTSGGGSGRVIG